MKKKKIKLSEIVHLYKRKMDVAYQVTLKMGLNRSKESECLIVNHNTAKAYIKQYQDEGYEIINDLKHLIDGPQEIRPVSTIIDIQAKEI